MRAPIGPTADPASPSLVDFSFSTSSPGTNPLGQHVIYKAVVMSQLLCSPPSSSLANPFSVLLQARFAGDSTHFNPSPHPFLCSILSHLFDTPVLEDPLHHILDFLLAPIFFLVTVSLWLIHASMLTKLWSVLV